MSKRMERIATDRLTQSMLLFWILLFIVTISVSGLSARSLLSAFTAWVAGLLTAEIVYRIEGRHEEDGK